MLNNQLNESPSSKTEVIETMLKTLTMLSSEVMEKRTEMDRVKTNIKQGKAKYNTEIKQYSLLTKQIIKLEEQIEVIENQNAKKKTAQNVIIMNITKDFFKNCVDILPQISSTAYKVLLKVCGFENEHHHSEWRIFNTVIKDESELKALIENVDKVQLDYYYQNESLLNSIKAEVNDIIMLNDVLYPYDIFFDYFRLVYEIIENNKDKAVFIDQIDEKNNIKNNTFLGLKELESEIMSNDEAYHSLANHIKGINSLLNSYKQLKSSNSSNDALIVFASRVKDFKQFNYNNNALIKFDIMNSLTVQSEYSEDRSEISSIADAKLNNNNKSGITSVSSTPVVIKPKNTTSSKEVANNKIQAVKRAGNKTSLNKSNNNINDDNNNGLSVSPPNKKQLLNLIDFNKLGSNTSTHINNHSTINKTKSRQNDKVKSKSEIATISKVDSNTIQQRQIAQDELALPLSPMIDMNSVKDIDSVCNEIEESLPIQNISMKSGQKFTYPSLGNNTNINQNISGRKRVFKEIPFLRFEKPVNSSDCCVACT